MQREIELALEAQGVTRQRVLVAVSGGVDSTVLAHVLAGLAERLELSLAIGHVDHGLRGVESDADVESVSALAASLELPFHVRRVAPEELRSGVASRVRPTLQEAARTLRREALREMQNAARADAVATAHNADDQAETVLLRLVRGCGPDSLGGIPERSPDGCFVRPMLGVTRAEIEEYAQRHGLAWREDASNRNPAYARNRLRRDVLPQLARDFNPKLLRAIGDLAEAERRDAEWLESLVDAEAERRFSSVGGAIVISGEGIGELPEGLARRLVRRLLTLAGGGRDVRRVHLLRTLAFLRDAPREGAAPRTLELPGGWRLEPFGADFRLRLEPGPGRRSRSEAGVRATEPRSGEGGVAVLRSPASPRPEQ